MPSNLNTHLLSAAMLLAALLLCAPGAPVENAPTYSPGGDSSGEQEVESTDLLSESRLWKSVICTIKRHQTDFENEFENVKYVILDNYHISHPAGCPASNFSKEACLRRLVEGLQTYEVLLKYVEREYPTSVTVSQVKNSTGHLIDLLKKKMKNAGRVIALTSIQEEKLLKNIDNPDTFHRKMTAYNILRQLQYFLIGGKRSIAKREKTRR